MALRGQCAQVGSGSSWTFVYSGANNIAVGDLIVVVTNQNGGAGGFTVTGPGASFTKGASLTPTLGGTINGNAWDVSVAIAAAGDVGTPTYSTTSTVGGGNYVQEIYVYSQRVNSSIAAAFSNSAMTTPVSPGTSSATFNMTGLTALTGDDILICNPITPTTGTNQTFTTSATGYGNALTIAQTATNSPTMNGLTSANSSAGATGTIAVSVTASGGSGNNWFIGGFVLSLPSNAPPYTVASSSTPSITGTTGTFTLPETCAPNDLILVQWAMDNVGSVSIPTITDNVNNVTYTPFGPPVFYSASSRCYGQSFVACVANGTPVIHITNLSANNMQLQVMHVTGFTGIPTLDQLAATTNPATTSVANTITTTKNISFVAASTFSGSTFTSTPSGWTSTFSGGNGAITQIYWQYAASTGAVALSGTLAASSYYYSFEYNFYNGLPPTSYYVDGSVWF